MTQLHDTDAPAPPQSGDAHRPPTDDAPSPRTAAAVVAGFTALALGVSVLGGSLLNPTASTSDGDYAGETVEMMIPLAEGGGTDTWARFVATELTREVPGSPGLAPVNDDGGEGILGTNHFMSSARPDGTEVLVSTASTVVPYLLDMPAVRYDFAHLRGNLAKCFADAQQFKLCVELLEYGLLTRAQVRQS